jgi:hypothetical protein
MAKPFGRPQVSHWRYGRWMGGRSRWLTRREFVDRIVARQADPALTAELASLADDTTDDVPLR